MTLTQGSKAEMVEQDACYPTLASVCAHRCIATRMCIYTMLTCIETVDSNVHLSKWMPLCLWLWEGCGWGKCLSKAELILYSRVAPGSSSQSRYRLRFLARAGKTAGVPSHGGVADAGHP